MRTDARDPARAGPRRARPPRLARAAAGRAPGAPRSRAIVAPPRPGPPRPLARGLARSPRRPGGLVPDGDGAALHQRPAPRFPGARAHRLGDPAHRLRLPLPRGAPRLPPPPLGDGRHARRHRRRGVRLRTARRPRGGGGDPAPRPRPATAPCRRAGGRRDALRGRAVGGPDRRSHLRPRAQRRRCRPLVGVAPPRGEAPLDPPRAVLRGVRAHPDRRPRAPGRAHRRLRRAVDAPQLPRPRRRPQPHALGPDGEAPPGALRVRPVGPLRGLAPPRARGRSSQPHAPLLPAELPRPPRRRGRRWCCGRRC